MDKEIAQVIAQQLAQVGIRVNLKPTEYGQFQTLVKGQTISPLYVSGGNNVWFDADPQITAFYGTGGALSTYSNPALDELIVKARTSIDPDERVSIYETAIPWYATRLPASACSATPWCQRSTAS